MRALILSFRLVCWNILMLLKPISEQIRVLNKGGIWFGYIVPEMENIVPKVYLVNNILKTFQNDKFMKF